MIVVIFFGSYLGSAVILVNPMVAMQHLVVNFTDKCLSKSIVGVVDEAK